MLKKSYKTLKQYITKQELNDFPLENLKVDEYYRYLYEQNTVGIKKTKKRK